jgi:hypothetical protein
VAADQGGKGILVAQAHESPEQVAVGYLAGAAREAADVTDEGSRASGCHPWLLCGTVRAFQR